MSIATHDWAPFWGVAMAVVESLHFNCKVNYLYESKFTMTCMNGLYIETVLWFFHWKYTTTDFNLLCALSVPTQPFQAHVSSYIVHVYAYTHVHIHTHTHTLSSIFVISCKYLYPANFLPTSQLNNLMFYLYLCSHFSFNALS